MKSSILMMVGVAVGFWQAPRRGTWKDRLATLRLRLAAPDQHQSGQQDDLIGEGRGHARHLARGSGGRRRRGSGRVPEGGVGGADHVAALGEVLPGVIDHALGAN